MVWSLYALCIGFCIDLIVGDPHGFPHPVVGIGRLISLLERLFRRLLPKTKGGEIAAGACIWVLTVLISAGLPAALLYGAQKLSVWLRLALESVMCWQILATKSLRDESMKVFSALRGGTPAGTRRSWMRRALRARQLRLWRKTRPTASLRRFCFWHSAARRSDFSIRPSTQWIPCSATWKCRIKISG